MRAVIDGLRQVGYLVELAEGGDSIVWRFAGVGQPDPEAVRPLLAQLAAGKTEALKVLGCEREEYLQEAFEERAAILEYDAGLARSEAEHLARGMAK